MKLDKAWRMGYSESDTVTTEVGFIGKLTAGLLNYVVSCIVGGPDAVLQCSALHHLS